MTPNPAVSITHKHARTAPVSIELDRDHAGTASKPIRDITIEWRVSRRALGSHQLAGNSPIVTLALSLKPTIEHRAIPTWTLIDPSSDDQLVIESTDLDEPISIVRDQLHIHLRSSHFKALLRRSDADDVDLVYVRTHIFNHLQIPGGRYEPHSARIGA